MQTKLSQFEIDRYYEAYRDLFGRECVCSHKELNAIVVEFDGCGLTLILLKLQERVGQPGWRGDSGKWPTFEELPTI